jgi:dihydrofolate reductase
MVVINMIAAISKRGGIGLNNKIPWNLRADLVNFKKATVGYGNNSVIMGRKTWESLDGKHLSERKNIVVSSKLDNKDNNIKVVSSLDKALMYNYNNGYDAAWIIGGSRIYDEALATHKVSGLYITRVDTDTVCDTFFPHINKNFDLNKVGMWRMENDQRYRHEYYVSKKFSTQIYDDNGS